jgi:diadenosine tetraphosphate (Ap4A) HIT family hydrolase
MKVCKFCNLSHDEKIIFQTKYFTFLLNKFPIIKEHYLLISKEHIKEEREIIEKYLKDYFFACKKAYRYLLKQTGRKPLSFINPPQMQSIAHFHRHYVDGIFGIHGVAKALENFLTKK